MSRSARIIDLQRVLRQQKRAAAQRQRFENEFDRGVRGFFEFLQSTDVCAAAREQERRQS